MIGRSSEVSLADDHCPAAWVHSQIGTPREKTDGMMVGVCAHAFSEHCFRDSRPAALVADGVQVALVGDGRRFEGGPPEHASPRQAQEGRDLALRYMDRENTPEPGEATVHTELGVLLALPAWKVTDEEPDPKRHYWRQALDYVAEYQDEDATGDPVSVGHVVDWKGWNFAGWHDSTQGRAAAVSVYALTRPDIIRRTVASYRLGSWETQDLDLRYDEDRDTLDDYRHGLGRTVEGLARLPLDIERVANPGIGCYGCPFFQHCRPAKRHLDTAEEIPAGVYAMVEALPVYERAAKDIRSILRKWCAIHGEAEGPGGSIGLAPGSWRKPDPNAAAILGREWAERVAALPPGSDAAVYLAGAIETVLKASRVGVTAIERLAKRIGKGTMGRDEIIALTDRCIMPDPKPKLDLAKRRDPERESRALMAKLQQSIDEGAKK